MGGWVVNLILGVVYAIQGQPGRVGDVPDLREMVAARKGSFSEVKLARRRKSKDQSLTVWM
jgi:hypothetical protein